MPKKRGNNDGSIRQRANGTWEARYVAGYLPDGKPDRKSIYAATQEEVQKKLREVLRQIDRGEYVEPSKVTVSQWLDTWYNVYGLPRWRDNTASVHQDSIRLHVKPALGKIALQKLRVDQIQRFVNEQAEKGFAPATIKKRFFPLQAALKQAVKNQLILRNPAQDVKLPQMAQKEIAFLTIEEQKLLLPCLPDTTIGRGLKFILSTGLRASELCGLRWMDIDADCFHVRQTAYYVSDKDGKQRLSISPPKSKASRRSIPLLNSTKALIDEQRKEQISARLALGSAWQGPNAGSGECFVFASETGTALDRNNVARTLRASLAKAGLKSRGPHALRHSFATNCVRSGMDIRTLSEILGHTDIALTLRLYVHSDMDTKRKGMAALDALLQ